ncbi:helix-turn-helix transcriptional regulator [Vibrio japonicus]|uniref:Response regulator transcription factor n=1 Tax=Vibrio japonicus TaxID=1824638 RepID=A0ABY5LIC2_9VIBR|nr:response regulator transcription factor [Vibrio japonicus]UUM31769.1 response regulator transcription factor [Vibrio japonicus]
MGIKPKTYKNKWHILLDDKNSFHAQLIIRELRKNENLIVTKGNANNIDKIVDKNNVDIVLLSFTCLKTGKHINDIYSNGQGVSLIVYGIPRQISYEELSSWVCMKGMIYEDAPIEHLIKCIEAVTAGGLWLPRRLMERMLDQLRPYILSQPDGVSDLTKREKQILNCLVHGHSNLEIADRLHIAESTVKTHLYKLYKKLNVSSRREAIQVAKQHQ